MASVASPFRGQISPSKRAFGSGVTRPVKRLHSLNTHNKRSRLLESTPTKEPTGLENHFKSNMQFVEATKATLDDEAKRSLIHEEDSSPKKRRKLSQNVVSTCGPVDLSERGFRNLTGNMCYRSSLFQSLCNTPKFVNWLLQYHSPEDCVTDAGVGCITCAMRKLVQLYWNQDATAKRLTTHSKHMHVLFRELGWKTHSMNGHGDPDDQLVWILDRIREEVPKSVFDSFDAIHNLVLRSEIKCENCGYASRSDGNEERLLSVPIRPKLQNSTLEAYIIKYMEEVIHDYTCEKCKFKSNKQRKQQILYAPDVLLVQLKRFDHNGQKDNLKVFYRSDLDLSRFSADPSQGPLNYELKSIVSHFGGTGGGHYIAMARSQAGKKWFEFDDEFVRPTGVDRVLDPSKSSSGFTPYLLFFERKPNTIPQ